MFNIVQENKSNFLSFKEKTNLLTIFSLVLTYGFYFFRVLQSNSTNLQLGTLLSVTIIFILMQILLRSVMPFVFKQEAQSSSSTLEKEALLQANKAAYYVLLAGIFASLILSISSATSFWLIPNMVLFVVLSELTKQTAELVLLRRSQLTLF